ncbi:16S rRNA (adenine(1518)-N(6)/adenine(1519)-N(6))-dimethyltransferase RsmA [Chitiniphilus purpureus]|uniref:Ribosomal RNA small subunit methyltransferase A n=1 Tax=Chitiniphilus purpureus TaxID=2981137 RepID=A0ABY6DKZ1_9NEIS|nr:16S rRNA (adenine(1518)-N(6)/adenine(1519)-N(6))-dimethyltransferase RsmA [Chitiniphilus sp. CD1]UXY15030.1 16S rRNA (adenine(1518)-N(6)/adenine(1519)-N(6))-dimethyltransferase RsmA [Chitiniphilus sp. CD1]
MTHIPRKRFGQNFLQDQGVIADIVNAVDPDGDDVLVEIGPGLAALTAPLIGRAGRLHAVEIDRDIVAYLRQHFDAEELVIHNVDALKFDFGALADEIAPGRKLRLVGNLPYNISTPLLFHLAQFAPRIADMHFMLQKEVVDRMVAEPSTADYGRLSIMLQLRFYMERVLDVPPGAFHPPPKVDSAVVRMLPWPQPPFPVADPARLEDLVAAAFTQRRKTLRNNLKGIVDDAQFAALGIDPGLRPENLQVGQFVALANALESVTPVRG